MKFKSISSWAIAHGVLRLPASNPSVSVSRNRLPVLRPLFVFFSELFEAL